MSHRRLLAALVTALVLLPQAAGAAEAPIEGFARYQPQTHCNPKPKPGTLKLAAWLQKTYPGSGSLGISAPCKGGGVSEHKEGRAFDWAVNVHSARDRGYVRDLFHRIFATDAEGNADALARRMGIMYLIWNDHIYSSYYGFRRRPYLSAGCKSIKRCNDTLRHRTHVHISLTRRGGAGLTSWYTGGVVTTPPTGTPTTPTTPTPPTPPAPTPAPPRTRTTHRPAPRPAPVVHHTRAGGVLDLRSHQYARLLVPTDGRARQSRFKLAAGHAYVLTVAGLYTYGAPQQVADAVCSWSARDTAWTPAPNARVARVHGSLDLQVNGSRPFGGTCNADSHVYRATFTPRHDRPLTLAVANRGSSAGALVVTVSRRGTDVTRALPSYPVLHPAPAPTDTASPGHGLLAEDLAVPAAEPVTTDEQVEAGAQYRITVDGTVGLGRGAASDGQCVAVRGAWYQRASLDPRFPAQDHGQLYVDGVPFAGDGGCGTREHATTWTATRTGRLTFTLWDPLDASDDQGTLDVQVQRLSPIPTPASADPAKPQSSWQWMQGRDWFSVDSDSTDGAVSSMRLRAGETVRVFVQGMQRSGGTVADGSCVLTKMGWLPRDPSVALDQDPLDLWVDGAPVDWQPLGHSSGACSDQDHAYTTQVTATKDGPLRLAVLDLDHTDNDGTLEVTLLRG